MAATVTAPLERQFGQMPGLKQMTSTSAIGSSVIVLQFALDVGLDVAEQEVQAAINAAATFLPRDLPTPPVYNKVNPADAPILTLALTSKTLAAARGRGPRRYAFRADASRSYPAWVWCRCRGGQRPAVRIAANPTALAARDLSPRGRARGRGRREREPTQGQPRRPAPRVHDQHQRSTVSSADYRSIIVAYRNGAAVLLSDVAEVSDGIENAALAAWKNDTGAILVNVQRQPGANVIKVADSVKATARQHAQRAAGGDRRRGARRSHDDDPRLGARRAARAGAGDGAGRAGDLPVPAQRAGDRDPERRRAGLPRRHVRRDAPARLQPEQPDADGAHDLDRLRGRRRNRDDRERLALRGRRASRRCRRHCAARSRSRSRSCR